MTIHQVNFFAINYYEWIREKGFEKQNSSNSPTQTRCVYETQMPLITANFIDGQDHKEKYFDTSKKILSQEMAMCNMETLISYFLEILTNVNFLLNGQMSRSKY